MKILQQKHEDSSTENEDSSPDLKHEYFGATRSSAPTTAVVRTGLCEFCIKNDDFCIKNDEFCIQTSYFGGNNYPLRGMKFTDFEGGTRVSSWVSGGVLSVAQRGSTHDKGLVHVADWMSTFCHLAGMNPLTFRLKKSGIVVNHHDL